MANGVFNVARGRINELHDRVVNSDPTNAALVLVILKTAESDATLIDYDTLGALLAGSNVEADFTNYARIVLTDADLSATSVNDTSDRRTADMGDQTWASAGGASNNTTAKIIICYDSDTTGGTDANLIPLAHYDFVATTDGNNLVAQIGADGYFYA